MVKRKDIPFQDWLTVRQVADSLGVTTRYIEMLCASGKVECLKVVDRWLVNPQSVAEWKPKRKRKAKNV